MERRRHISAPGARWPTSVVKQRVDELAERIDAPASLLPTYGRSEHMARPYIESADDMFSYVVVERGIRLRHEATTDLDELLYWIFRSVTFDMSTKFEVQNRAEDQDFRIIQCRHQLALVARLRPHWDRRYTSEKRDRLGGLGIEIDPTIRSCVARLIWLSCHFCGSVAAGKKGGSTRRWMTTVFTLSHVSASSTLSALVLRPGQGAASASQPRRVRSGDYVGGQTQARFQHAPVGARACHVDSSR
jgi:hypothetical protein